MMENIILASCNILNELSEKKFIVIDNIQQLEVEINNCYLRGGRIRLDSGQNVFEPREGFRVDSSMVMLASPSKFVIFVDYFDKLSKSYKKRLWYSKNVEFNGKEKIEGYEHEFSNKVICNDSDIAFELFNEFIESKGLNETINSLTIDESLV